MRPYATLNKMSLYARSEGLQGLVPLTSIESILTHVS